MEAERVFGCIAIGIGKYPVHTDGVIKNHSIEVDKQVIEENGSFVPEELLSLEGELLRNK